jgi:predicted transcriptional regulator of viral defense system
MLTRPVTTVLVSTPRLLARREILGMPYRFVHAPPSALWGNEPVWVTPYEQVTVSELERTILDGLVAPICVPVSVRWPPAYGCATMTWTGTGWPTTP